MTVALPSTEAGPYELKTSIRESEARVLVEAALANARIRSAADDKVNENGPVPFAVQIPGGGTYRFTYDGDVTSGGGAPAYTVSGSRDTALSVVNSDEKTRLLACLVADGLIAVTAAKATEQAAFNAARSQAANSLDCDFGVGSKVTFRGLTGTAEAHERGLFKADVGDHLDYLVLNKFGAPVGWLPKSAERLSEGNAQDESDTGITKVSKQAIANCKAEVVAEFAADVAALREKMTSDPYNAGGNLQALIQKMQAAEGKALTACEYLAGGDAA